MSDQTEPKSPAGVSRRRLIQMAGALTAGAVPLGAAAALAEEHFDKFIS